MADKNGGNGNVPIEMKSEIAGAGDPLVLVPGGLTGCLSRESHAKELSENYRVVARARAYLETYESNRNYCDY